MTERATGTFAVSMTPQAAPASLTATALSRMALDKQFAGDLMAHSVGEMLAAGTAVEGSAAYSALEQVTGTLGGRSGSFVLQHTGVMDRGAPSLRITVVPDSGTDALSGLSGTMEISIDADQHRYVLDYQLP